ncbi:hypothetical protein FE257_007952 [Aspergillus nanangensis]|uniref:Fatty acyl-CoA reductase n=1 Tax=Aspergillus nanangensis TaxID=2582783 RepID=A0AAD4GY22_ASPNN|nr:hypothetical protein FE257_007952 [Aspergillus nanangensis]
MTASSQPCILVTGTTGFLGKVVLEHLVRQHEAFGLQRIVVLIRDKRGTDSQTRFRDTVSSSPCFSLLPSSWTDNIEVVSGDITTANLGFDPVTYKRLSEEVTHIIHCAGCVKFDLSLSEAAVVNISSVLNLLDFAQGCPNIQHFVHTSTAYVTPHYYGPIYETLGPLPGPAWDLYQRMLTGDLSKKKVLSDSGLPNSYNLSKSIAEHLLVTRKGHVPLTIVRPSIISASWQHPFPGWIDSLSAFAGFLAAYGNGFLRVIDANPQTILDIVPVDEVASRLISAALSRKSSTSTEGETVKILYATASLPNGLPIQLVFSQMTSFFADCQTASFRKPHIHYLGPYGTRFRINAFLYQSSPLWVATALSAVQGKSVQSRKLKSLRSGLSRLNRDFPYFTHRTFNFRPSIQLPDEFSPEVYLGVVLAGICQNLLPRTKERTLEKGRSKPRSLVQSFLPPRWLQIVGFTGAVLATSRVCLLLIGNHYLRKL